MAESELRSYRVWDGPTRAFHWINALTVLALAGVGLIVYFRGDLGISGTAAKVGLKELHVWIGYVFVVNLLWRLIWAFFGNRYAGWRAIVPGRGFMAMLRAYLAALHHGHPQQYLGHNPLGRLALVAIYLLLITMAVTGLVRAGTDLYYPPFGGAIRDYVVATGGDPAALIPYDDAGVDPQRLESLGRFKHPFGLVHFYTAWLTMLMIVLHLTAVVIAEQREGGALVSAMITGRKVLSAAPEDDTGER